jgi:hypothetical protein
MEPVTQTDVACPVRRCSDPSIEGEVENSQLRFSKTRVTNPRCYRICLNFKAAAMGSQKNEQARLENLSP